MTKAKDLSLQATRRARQEKTESLLCSDTLGKSTPRLQSLTVKAKQTTWWLFTVLCHSYFHTVEKRNGYHYVSFHFKSANGKSKVLIFRTEAEHIPSPASLKCWCLQGLLHDSWTLWSVTKFVVGLFFWDHRWGKHLHLCKKHTGFFAKVSFDSS